MTVRTTPQRVVRMQEWRWCVTEKGGAVIKRTVFQIDGVDGAAAEERLVFIEGGEVRFDDSYLR